MSSGFYYSIFWKEIIAAHLKPLKSCLDFSNKWQNSLTIFRSCSSASFMIAILRDACWDISSKWDIDRFVKSYEEYRQSKLLVLLCMYWTENKFLNEEFQLLAMYTRGCTEPISWFIDFSILSNVTLLLRDYTACRSIFELSGTDYSKKRYYWIVRMKFDFPLNLRVTRSILIFSPVTLRMYDEKK